MDAAKEAVLNETTDSIFKDNIKDLSDIRKNIMWLLAAKEFTPEELATKLNTESQVIIGHLGRLETLGLLSKADDKWEISNDFFKAWLNLNRTDDVQKLLAEPEEVKDRTKPWKWSTFSLVGILTIIGATLLFFKLNKILFPLFGWWCLAFMLTATTVAIVLESTIVVDNHNARKIMRWVFGVLLAVLLGVSSLVLGVLALFLQMNQS